MARKVSEINAGSMADIAFLLLIFFLVTTTMDVDSGLSRQLPPLPDNTPPPKYNKRNLFVVLVNKNDQLLVRGKPGDINTLKEDAKRFFSNPTNDPNLPEKKLEYVEGLGEVEISKGIVSLQNDRGTSYEMYIKVQNELTAAVNELRDEYSLQKFGVKYKDLKDEELRKAIQTAIPVAISEAEPKDVGGN